MIDHTVTIIGLGGIGSWTAELIARVGCQRIVIMDHDIVEPHNCANQNYSYPDDIGQPKVEATKKKLQKIAEWHSAYGREMDIIALQERATERTIVRGIVVVAVDSGQARKDIFHFSTTFNPSIPLYIEAGAAENKGRVTVLIPHDKDQVEPYKKYLETIISGNTPMPCVSPTMGGQFASIIARYIVRFNEGWRPDSLLQSYITYEANPSVETSPVY